MVSTACLHGEGWDGINTQHSAARTLRPYQSARYTPASRASSGLTIAGADVSALRRCAMDDAISPSRPCALRLHRNDWMVTSTRFSSICELKLMQACGVWMAAGQAKDAGVCAQRVAGRSWCVLSSERACRERTVHAEGSTKQVPRASATSPPSSWFTPAPAPPSIRNPMHAPRVASRTRLAVPRSSRSAHP